MLWYSISVPFRTDYVASVCSSIALGNGLCMHAGVFRSSKERLRYRRKLTTCIFFCRAITLIGFRAPEAPIARYIFFCFHETLGKYTKSATHAYWISGSGGTHRTEPASHDNKKNASNRRACCFRHHKNSELLDAPGQKPQGHEAHHTRSYAKLPDRVRKRGQIVQHAGRPERCRDRNSA